MMPKQETNFWEGDQEVGSEGVMPQNNVISGAVSPEAYQIPLGATHHVMFPQTNAALALVLAIASFACGGFLMSIPALLIALSAKKITDNNAVHPDRGIANAAYITAIVNICLSAIVTVAYIGMIFVYTM